MTPEIIARVDGWLKANVLRRRGAVISLMGAWNCVTYGGAISGSGDVAMATGILLALVREAWGDPGIYAQYRGVDGWWVWESDPAKGTLARHWPSEAEALAAALEAAPAKEAA